MALVSQHPPSYVPGSHLPSQAFPRHTVAPPFPRLVNPGPRPVSCLLLMKPISAPEGFEEAPRGFFCGTGLSLWLSPTP